LVSDGLILQRPLAQRQENKNQVSEKVLPVCSSAREEKKEKREEITMMT
jgi:hypothetical protein